ncbi:EamA family transporter RarD [Anaerotruncus colihominis]|uniref:EamA family transporter RarD n=1 Tax=Anaerotruncus colihominis TaxID=169435 RepID=UPI00189ABB93
MKKALACAFGSTVVWGCLPLFWRALAGLPPLYILSSRILWATLFSGVLIAITGRWPQVRALLRNQRCLFKSAAAGWMIAANWLLGIIAVNSGRTLDSTMGSFLNSLTCCLAACLFFHEHPNRVQAAGIFVAGAGVLWMTVYYGQIPWIALFLAGTFGIYSTCKKALGLDALVALFVEGAAVLPFCLPFVLVSEIQGAGALALLPAARLWLVPAIGIVTGLPLVLYAKSLQVLPLGLAGFLQYITSFISLLIALAVFHEHFSAAYLAGYGFIWAALIIFSLGSLHGNPSRDITSTP